MAQKKKRRERALDLRMSIEPTGEKGAYDVWCNGFGYANCVVHAPSAKVARHAVEGFLWNELSAIKTIESDEFDEKAEK